MSELRSCAWRWQLGAGRVRDPEGSVEVNSRGSRDRWGTRSISATGCGAETGGWYNRLWLRGLQAIEDRGLSGNDAASAIMDFVRDEVFPATQEAFRVGGALPGS